MTAPTKSMRPDSKTWDLVRDLIGHYRDDHPESTAREACLWAVSEGLFRDVAPKTAPVCVFILTPKAYRYLAAIHDEAS